MGRGYSAVVSQIIRYVHLLGSALGFIVTYVTVQVASHLPTAAVQAQA